MPGTMDVNGAVMSENKPQDDADAVDPRAVTDKEVLEEYSREQVERWRREAHERHRRWMEVMHNSYGRE